LEPSLSFCTRHEVSAFQQERFSSLQAEMKRRIFAPLYEEYICRSSVKMIGKSRMELVEKISMPNGLTAEVWDKSSVIAADTTKVELLIRIRVELKQSYFTKPDHYELVRKIMGPEIFFEYKRERTFVRNKEKDVVFKELLDNFKKNSLPYLSKNSFPRSFSLSKYWDMEKNYYKYAFFVGEKRS
jgi:hypothetical protein